MKYFYFIAILVAGLHLGCNESDDHPAKPDNILGKEKFTEVLTDVQLLEASMKQRFIREEDPKTLYAVYYTQIFEKHNVNRESFVKSFEYWADRDEEMEEIYDDIIERLAKMEDPTMNDQ